MGVVTMGVVIVKELGKVLKDLQGPQDLPAFQE
jgi:hypothetical protein